MHFRQRFRSVPIPSKILVVRAVLVVLAICPSNVRQWLVGGFRTFHAAELVMQLAACL